MPRGVEMSLTINEPKQFAKPMGDHRGPTHNTKRHQIKG
jgi:hypothetical protein